MKQNIIKIVCLTALLMGVGSTQAQFRQSIFLNGNIPMGGFASSANGSASINGVQGVPWGMANMGKEASIGFGGGYRASYRFDVGVGEVAPFAQADFLWNTIDGDWSDSYANYDLSTPTYFNLPIMAGVSYLYDELWSDITLYGEFGLGVDFLFITPEGTSNKSGRYAYKPTGAFAWMLGAGAYFGRHVSAGLYFYGMGKHYIDYTSSTIDNNSSAKTDAAQYTTAHKRESRTVNSLMLRIGFHF